MTSFGRRSSHEAGERWRKDWPGFRKETLTETTTETIVEIELSDAVVVWAWSIALGLWLGIAAFLLS